MKNRKIIILSFVLACALVLTVLGAAGCSSSTPAPTTGSTPTTPSSTPTSVPSTAPPPPITLNAAGTANSKTFNLSKGLALFQIVYQGGDNITAQLLDANAAPVATLVNATGPINGRQSEAVTGGAYSISVTSTNVWTIYVTQPTPINVPYIPKVFSGVGLDVTDFFQCPLAGMKATITASGSGPFKATLLNSSGDVVTVILDAAAPVNEAVDVPTQTGVPYLIDVEATGPWQILLQ